MSSARFTKVKENFICANCAAEVIGNGYTNHCPHCLYSKHVDRDNPGDRASDCGGLMKAVGITIKGGQPFKILFICELCGKEILNKISPDDSIEIIANLPAIIYP